ncbi:MAG: zf-HC2 domain-containing protein [bacterium]|nr:zf-HC2 domain-containing protein [bacterium]
MTCEKRKRDLSLYLDKELSQERSKDVEKHLSACNACLKEFESLKRNSEYMKKLFGTIDIPDLPLDFERKFYEQVNQI